jgi:NADPH:quinone reductase-like Zn-dependent oxidoreductase
LLNLDAPDPADDGIDFVANKARSIETQYAICNGFGFGGVNASALFRRARPSTERLNLEKEEIIMNKTNSSVALITGASSGIGKATAKALLAAGYRVFGTSRRATPETLDGLTMLTCDVTDEDSVAKMVENVLAETGRIDLLVNNAGMGLLGALRSLRRRRLGHSST